MRRDYQAVIMQFGSISVLSIGSFPYFHQAGIGLDRDFVAILMGIDFLLAVVSIVVGWGCGLSVFSAPPAGANPKVDEYITSMAVLDIALFALVVALSGGLTDSSFVSLLFLVPALAMLNGAKGMWFVMGWFILCFVLLVALKLPEAQRVVSNLLGRLAWLMSYKGTANRGAYEGSTILVLFFSVLATYAQYSASRRQPVNPR